MQQQAGFAGNGPFVGMPEAEIANLVQAFGQDVLQEAAHELLSIEGAGAPAVGLAMLVAEGNGVLVERDDAIGPLLRKPRPDLAAHELGDGCLGGKVGGAGGMPARGSSGGDAATGN